jgi:hypothetical protein
MWLYGRPGNSHRRRSGVEWTTGRGSTVGGGLWAGRGRAEQRSHGGAGVGRATGAGLLTAAAVGESCLGGGVEKRGA